MILDFESPDFSDTYTQPASYRDYRILFTNFCPSQLPQKFGEVTKVILAANIRQFAFLFPAAYKSIRNVRIDISYISLFQKLFQSILFSLLFYLFQALLSHSAISKILLHKISASYTCPPPESGLYSKTWKSAPSQVPYALLARQ